MTRTPDAEVYLEQLLRLYLNKVANTSFYLKYFFALSKISLSKFSVVVCASVGNGMYTSCSMYFF